MQAIKVIRSEHCSLAAVLHGMLYLVRHIRYGAEPSFDVLEAMVHYINAFPEQCHHPKEEMLFESVQARDSTASPLIERLQAEHRAGSEKIRRMELALVTFRQHGTKQLAQFSSAVADYATFQWDHASTEENELIPLAEIFLTTSDWDTINTAFAAHTDPLRDENPGGEYHELFRRIVKLAPSPLGYGPATHRQSKDIGASKLSPC